jgi:putative peptide zinc metalloprotease protein
VTDVAENDLALTAQTRLVLRPLSVTVRGPGELLVGDLSRGEFVVLPEIAGTVLQALREGGTLGQVAASLRTSLGEDIDVLDFATALLDLGFVAAVDDVEIASLPGTLYTGGRIAAAAVRFLRPLFTPPAWVCYAALLLIDLIMLAGVPSLRPHAAELYFLRNPLLSLACVTATTTVAAGCHELAHWLAARNEGVPARVTISRRGFFLVYQTDLTALRTIPRRRRLGPLLAGLACDTVLLSLFVLPRAGAAAGWWRLTGTLAGYLAAVSVGLGTVMLFQVLVFMRTDLYAVLALGFDCLNLTEVSRLMVRAWVRPLTDAQRAELDAADPNDLRVARWYRVLLAAGIVAGAGYFVAIFIPAAWRIITWIVLGLAHHPPETVAFWEALAAGAILLFPVTAPLVLFVREHHRLPHATRRTALDCLYGCRSGMPS